MNASTRTEAQRRADDMQIFQRELQRLENEGVLTLEAAQRDAVQAHHARLLGQYEQTYDIDRDIKSRQLSLGMKAASFLGALALAASVFYLFRQFWGDFHTWAQTLLLIAAALGSFGFTLWLQGRDASGYFTKLSAMVAFTCFVLNVTMLGSIFNITPTDKAMLAWAAFAFLLAYTCDLRLLLAAGILCLTGFIAARIGTWGGLYWLDFGERPENFFPAALAFMLFPRFVNHDRFPGFAALYRVFGLLTLLLPMLVLANWGEGSYLGWNIKAVENFYQIAGFVVSGLVIYWGIRKQMNEVFNTGTVFFVIFLYTKFYDWWWEFMPKYLFFLILGLTAILILLVIRRLRDAMLKKEGAR
ncbi:MAG: DUF2157 domain-containing protein [Methylobacillus sp.]|jgi:uncharacterized membrane protein|nr:DUF2157 domain-containing protein [Methylobacillus sp.]